MANQAGTYILNFDKCNQKCLFCSKSEEINLRRSINLRRVFSEIKKSKTLGYKKIDFYGGEPTRFPFLKRAIALANKDKFCVTLATNGVNFSSARFANNFFKGIKISGIRVPLHSFKPKVHDTITQVDGSFYHTLEGIKNILKFVKSLSINIVITSLNYKDISKMPEYIYNLGVRGIKFSGLVLCGRALSNKWLQVDQTFFELDLIKALKISKRMGFLCIECEKLSSTITKRRNFSFVKFIDMR